MKNDQKFTVDGDLVAESINLTSHITKLIDDQMIAKKDITFDSPTLISLNASALSAKETIIFNSQEFICELSVIRAGIMYMLIQIIKVLMPNPFIYLIRILKLKTAFNLLQKSLFAEIV